jgi:predicted porin
MKTTIKLAVASALLASAASAQAAGGIVAGDWTLDIGGVVNAYYTSTSYSGDNAGSTGPLGLGAGNQDTTNNITTGLLPNYLAVSGKTRQNDLDVAFTISINPGASTTRAGIQNQATLGGNQENRQAFLTFGDKSWGSIKLGKDLGIYASDAILNDMTLLGVGMGAGNLAGNTTTLGRIGTGFMYADWKSQVAYSSPNWNGFSFTAGVTQAWDALAILATSGGSTGRGGSSPAFEAKASYEWAGDVAGKVWASGITQKVENFGVGISDDRATAWDIGANVNVAGFGLTGYYGDGDGIGQTVQLADGFDNTGNSRDSDQWYVQGTYTLPGVGTKLGVSYGESTLDGNTAVDGFNDIEDSMWTVGAYHPITKHLNLVAEYSQSERDVDNVGAGSSQAKAKTISLGAILFF